MSYNFHYVKFQDFQRLLLTLECYCQAMLMQAAASGSKPSHAGPGLPSQVNSFSSQAMFMQAGPSQAKSILFQAMACQVKPSAAK
jgi:hypothetical protein